MNMKLVMYGRKIEIVTGQNCWIVYYLGNEGKKRDAHDIFIPAGIQQEEIVQYLEDMFHEWATPANPDITIVE